MAIEGNSPKQCFDYFRDHISKLVCSIIGSVPPLSPTRRPCQSKRAENFTKRPVLRADPCAYGGGTESTSASRNLCEAAL